MKMLRPVRTTKRLKSGYPRSSLTEDQIADNLAMRIAKGYGVHSVPLVVAVERIPSLRGEPEVGKSINLLWVAHYELGTSVFGKRRKWVDRAVAVEVEAGFSYRPTSTSLVYRLSD